MRASSLKISSRVFGHFLIGSCIPMCVDRGVSCGSGAQAGGGGEPAAAWHA